MLSALISLMERRGCFRMIHRQDSEGKSVPYLKRYYIFRSKWFGAFIHQFWSSDPDHLHSHPWANFSLILKGGYHESSIDGVTEFRNPGYFRFRQAQVFHRISIGPYSSGAAWTLFIHFRRTCKWGFLADGEWVESSQYGKKYGPDVEQEGKDFEITGHFFPKVRTIGQSPSVQETKAS